MQSRYFLTRSTGLANNTNALFSQTRQFHPTRHRLNNSSPIEMWEIVARAGVSTTILAGLLLIESYKNKNSTPENTKETSAPRRGTP